MSKGAVKNAARHAIYTKVRRGDIPPGSKLRCIDCGKRAREYDHAAGYEAAHILVVEPVCRSCHLKRAWARGERSRRLQSKFGRIGPVDRWGYFVSQASRRGRNENSARSTF